MRITNQMTMNKMLLNINRNQTVVDTLYGQLTTGKKIQRPSDNPIIASRALKFRTNVSQTVQYQKNVTQGLAWMNISEGGYVNATDILKSIRERCVEGASDTFTYDDRQKIAAAIESFASQLGAEMNVTYAGRYVFSGYRTDQPPIIENTDPNAVFEIKQSFSVGDIEFTKAYAKADSAALPDVSDVYRLKLPYTGVTGLDVTDADGNPIVLTDAGGNPVDLVVNTVDMSDPAQRAAAYNPPPGEANYIPETGEIIFNSGDMNEIRTKYAGGINVSYTKTGLTKGDLNPVVYFECRDISDPDPANHKSYNMNDQQLQFEFGVSTKITVNNLAKDALTANLYADLRALVDLLNGIELSSESDLLAKFKSQGLSDEEAEKQVQEQINSEKQLYRGVMQKAFSNMLGLIDGHSSQISKEYTLLGSRMNTLTLIENRLKEDKASYTDLMNDNENVDYLEVIMNLNSAEYVYTAALQAGGSIAQISLVDFIR